MAALTIKQAARKVGVRAEDIRKAISTGDLKSTESLRGEVVAEDDLLQWADDRDDEIAERAWDQAELQRGLYGEPDWPGDE